MQLILSLCDYTGNWSKPYRDAGYFVEQVDLKLGHDVRLLEYSQTRPHGIIMQPPCTHFAGSGALHWERKGEDALLEALQLVDACLRAVAIYEPEWWVLENPVGRLGRFIGKPSFLFHPYEFAGWASDPTAEAYTKKTCLWGKFNHPKRNPVEPVVKNWVHQWGGASERTKEARSVTPTGFAKAFFEANP